MEYGYTIKSELFQRLTLAVEEGTLPQEFESDFYRLIHPDLTNLNEEELYEHYRGLGIQEGRLASPAAHRAGFLKTISRDREILEVGPFTKPLLCGDKVKYFDVLDRQGLLDRAKSISFPIVNEVDIDFVSPNGDLSVVGREKFDIVISSHCIEHQPSLIKHLTDVFNILRPGGQYYLIVPDKRYCFDHYIAESEIDEVVRAHREQRSIHTIKSVYEHWVLTTHSNPVAHWMGHHEDPNASKRAERAHDTIVKYHASAGAYIDVHAWQFTPESLRKLIQGLIDRGLVNFAIERVYNTVWGSYEFMAVLRK
ncbi:methyltransferase domain-containing protein [Methylobacterium brachiatum]|uniref:methyltransferase domain-containing protein n=1 Tax=Methylobacterium brachiatum TaxID=269660 RepID=UPI000EFCCE0A|nr:methyltransferase domain-containing protein [Methylobacterium brachiatum]AYO81303.1 methyltransferase domain-containing protein [Methylobacterium brachiatum]